MDGVTVRRLGPILTLWWRTLLYYLRHCRGNYDVVVAEGFGGSRIPRFAPLYVKEPLLTEWHQIHDALFVAQYPPILLPFLRTLERLTAWVNRKTFVRAGTTEWRDAFSQLGFENDRVFVVPVGIRDEWTCGDRPGPVIEPRVIWLGKFRRYKRPDHVIRAMTRVLERVPDATLLLAGRHDDLKFEGELLALVSRLGLTKNVEFRFGINEEEKRDILSKSRVMVVSSPVEGFGIVVLEANACGVPVVASTGVPASVVTDRRNGLRYPYGDLNALANATIQVLTSDALYDALSASAFAFARQFPWSRAGAEYERVILSAAKVARPAEEVIAQ